MDVINMEDDSDIDGFNVLRQSACQVGRRRTELYSCNFWISC